MIAGKKLKTSFNTIGRSIMSLIAALIVVGIIIAISGYSPTDVYTSIFKGAFSTKMNRALVFSEATPLMFAGLAFAITFNARIINVAVEGQMIMGALVGGIAGAYITSLSRVPHTILILLLAGLSGALIGAFICFLKVRFQASEVVVSIMLNSIIVYFGSYLANGPLRAVGAGVAQTEYIQDTAVLTKIVPKSQFTTGYFIGIAFALLLAFILKRTNLGYQIRVTGNNKLAGETYGINTTKIYYATFMMSGFIAAVGGSVITQGVVRCFSDGALAGYGFQGISVAALAMYSPIGVILSSLLYGVLSAGSLAVNRTSGVPYEFVDVIQVLVVVFVSAPQIIGTVQKAFVSLVRKVVSLFLRMKQRSPNVHNS